MFHQHPNPSSTLRGAVRGALVLVAALSSACGGGSSSSPSPVAVATPTPPAAAVTATGNGTIVLHPSASRTFGLAMELPVRIQETGGGTADWNFARLAFFNRGVEVERVEIGADSIRSAGVTRITPNSNASYVLNFRFNSDTFDRIDVTLGFADIVTARQFTVAIPFSQFSCCNISTIPLLRTLN